MSAPYRGSTALPDPPDRYSVQDQVQLRLAIVRALDDIGRNDDATASPSQITANQDDYETGTLRTLRVSTDASRNLTGLAGGWPGRELRIINAGSQDIVLQNQNAGSSEGNRVITGTGADITLAADDIANLWYDGTTGRWRVE